MHIYNNNENDKNYNDIAMVTKCLIGLEILPHENSNKNVDI